MSVNVPHNKISNIKAIKKWTIGKERISRTGNVNLNCPSLPVCLHPFCIPQRSTTALSDYVKGQLADPVKEYTGGEAMGKLVCGVAGGFSCTGELHACMLQYCFWLTLLIPLLCRK